MEGLVEQIEMLKYLKSSGLLSEEAEKEIDEAISNMTKSIKEIDEKLPIRFINKSDNEDPKFANVGDSGFDLRANESGSLKPLERTLVGTGLYFQLPESFELQIRPRSGLAYKHGITVLNSPGTVDNGYTGEVKVLLVNLSNEPFSWEKGDRIAQGVVCNRLAEEYGELINVNEIKETERGGGGFGSTGVK
jgi:dUTP pyrophosphatase